jgi:rare lipoprotein A
MRPMTTRARRLLLAAPLTMMVPVAAAGAATAQAPAPPAPAAVPAGPAAATPPAAQAAKAHARMSIRSVRRNVSAGRRELVRGALHPGRAGRTVTLEARRGHAWHRVDRDRTSAGGAFRLRFTPRQAGSWKLRVRFRGDATTRPARRALGHVNVYRPALASWYGPGLYGSQLACGGRLAPGTLGVAHKSLPCGARVTLRYHGHSVRVRVVDRGPYVGAREFDLTAATRQRLHFGSTGTVLTTR